MGRNDRGPDYKSQQTSSSGGSVMKMDLESKRINRETVATLKKLGWSDGSSRDIVTIESYDGATPKMLRTLAQKLCDVAIMMEDKSKQVEISPYNNNSF